MSTKIRSKLKTTRSWLHQVRTKSYFTAQCKMLPTHRERLTKAPNQTADNFFFLQNTSYEMGFRSISTISLECSFKKLKQRHSWESWNINEAVGNFLIPELYLGALHHLLRKTLSRNVSHIQAKIGIELRYVKYLFLFRCICLCYCCHCTKVLPWHGACSYDTVH